MNKLKVFIGALLFSASFAYLLMLVVQEHKHQKEIESRVYRMNKHIQYLHDEEGYSWEAARKIGATEAGFISLDIEYKSLKED